MEIGFLGCGKIAVPMVRSLARRFPDAGIFVTLRSEHLSSMLEREIDNVHRGESQWVLDNSEIVVFSLLADVARTLFPSLAFRSDHKSVSVMTDIGLQEIHDLIRPASGCCITIPVPFIAQGGCPLPVYPDNPLIGQLFGDENRVFPVTEESHVNAHFAATAILSTLIVQLQGTSRWLGDRTGNHVDAEIYLASLAAGYLGAMDRDGMQRLDQAMEKLSTTGGLNHQLLQHMQSSGLTENLEKGLQQLARRLCMQA